MWLPCVSTSKVCLYLTVHHGFRDTRRSEDAVWVTVLIYTAGSESKSNTWYKVVRLAAFLLVLFLKAKVTVVEPQCWVVAKKHTGHLRHIADTRRACGPIGLSFGCHRSASVYTSRGPISHLEDDRSGSQVSTNCVSQSAKLLRRISFVSLHVQFHFHMRVHV